MAQTNLVQLICKNVFACLFSVHNTISLSRHEQVCFIKHTCSWHDKLIVLLAQLSLWSMEQWPSI